MSIARLQPRLDYLLAGGVLLALETQLRVEGMFLGPGELMLAIWIVLTAVIEYRRFRSPVPKAAVQIASFWLIFALAESIGLTGSLGAAEPLDLELVAHDIESYCLLAAISLLLTLDRESPRRLVRLQWIIVVMGSVLFAAQLANAAGIFAAPGIDPWYWDRLRAWTANPNQLALLCLLLGFLSLHLADLDARPLNRTFASLSALMIIGGGMLTKSNAYVISAFAALAYFGLAKLCRFALRFDRPQFPAAPIAAAAVSLSVYAVLVVAAASGLQNFAVASAAGGVARQASREFDESALRVEIWGNALERGTDAWMLGYGPGPHLAIPDILISGRRHSGEPGNVQHPREVLAPNFEAHNTTLELFLQGGVIGVASAAGIIGLAALQAWRARMDGLLALMLATAIFGSFHVISRHPFLWLVLCCALTAQPWLRTPISLRRTPLAPSHSGTVFQRQRKWAPYLRGL